MLFDPATFEDQAPVRLTAEPLPPYAYLPGRGPHPIRSEDGYLRGGHRPVALFEKGAIDAAQPDWRAGIDYYNQGFYWEAHERWEGLWQALGRRGDEALLLKALIQTAAAQIKGLEGNRRGIEILALKSGRMLRELADRRGVLLGLDLAAQLERRDAWFAALLRETGPRPTNFPFIVLDEVSR